MGPVFTVRTLKVFGAVERHKVWQSCGFGVKRTSWEGQLWLEARSGWYNSDDPDRRAKGVEISRPEQILRL